MKSHQKSERGAASGSAWNAPAYTVTDAARFLQLNPATVRSWFLGESRHGRQTFRPVLTMADRRRSYLSFENLVEIFVLSALRRTHSVKLEAIREAIRFLQKRWKHPHPLATGRILTDGAEVLVEEYGRLISATASGQTAMRVVLDRYLTRIRYEHGLPIRLHPITRPAAETTRVGIEVVPCSISIDPRLAFGRPCIAGTGIPASVVAERFAAGEDIGTLAEDYGRKPADIEEAIRFDRLVRAA